jgi:hypothetical protein
MFQIEKVFFAKVEVWFVLLALGLSGALGGFWMYASLRWDVPPGPQIQEIELFLAGDNIAQGSAASRLAAQAAHPDLFLRPTAVDLEGYTEVLVPSLNPRREPPRMLLAGPQPEYRFLVGAFDIKDAFWASLLLDQKGKVVHSWPLAGQEFHELNDEELNLYGVALFPDGSVIYTKQAGGGGLYKVDRCGRQVWAVKGVFHHAVSPNRHGGTFWTLGGAADTPFPDMVEIDVANGDIVRTINMLDVYRANPSVHIFDLRPRKANLDIPHANDIEPLSADLAPAFPTLDAGDLLVSYHTTNTVFVVDPESLEVKFYHVGAGDGAHDPDFDPSGEITLFNNNYRAQWLGFPPHSEVVAIDLQNSSHRTLLSGAPFGLESYFNGRHEIRDGKYVTMDASATGRFSEVDLETGEITFDFVNVYSEEKLQALHVTESASLATSFFNERPETWQCE